MLAYFIIALGVVVRILSAETDFAFFPPNFAPIGGMALFAGAYLTARRAYLVPLAALALSDLFIGWYDPIVMLAVYGSFAAITWLGTHVRQHKNVAGIAATAMIGSVFFFIVTNFAEWLRPESFYPHTAAGLQAAYMAGIPFFKYTLAGDLVFTGLFFGAFETARYLSMIVRRRQVQI